MATYRCFLLMLWLNFYRKSALKALSKMPRKLAEKFIGSFVLLSDNKEDGLDIKKLEGREGFRLRIGGYRAMYRKLNDVMVVVFVAGLSQSLSVFFL